jgi:hypothetical protein
LAAVTKQPKYKLPSTARVEPDTLGSKNSDSEEAITEKDSKVVVRPSAIKNLVVTLKELTFLRIEAKPLGDL